MTRRYSPGPFCDPSLCCCESAAAVAASVSRASRLALRTGAASGAVERRTYPAGSDAPAPFSLLDDIKRARAQIARYEEMVLLARPVPPGVPLSGPDGGLRTGGPAGSVGAVAVLGEVAPTASAVSDPDLTECLGWLS